MSYLGIYYRKHIWKVWIKIKAYYIYCAINYTMKQIIICFAFLVISYPDFQAQTKNQRDNTFEIFQTSDDDGEIEKINLGQNLVIARLNESKDYFYVCLLYTSPSPRD